MSGADRALLGETILLVVVSLGLFVALVSGGGY